MELAILVSGSVRDPRWATWSTALGNQIGVFADPDCGPVFSELSTEVNRLLSVRRLSLLSRFRAYALRSNEPMNAVHSFESARQTPSPTVASA